MRFHPFRHLGLKFLSLGLAALLWLTVARDPIVERTLRVPLQFQNVPTQLTIVGDPGTTVDVLVKGSSGLVSRLQPGELVVILDLATARSGSRLFHLSPDQVRAPFGLDVQHVMPATIALEFERTATRLVPVVPAVEGEPAPGYVVGTVASLPAQVEVVGPESHVKTVTEATTEPVSIEGATTTVQEEVTIGVADADVRLRETRTASVTAAITPASLEQSFENVPVRMRNTAAGLSAEAVPAMVDVGMRGPREALGGIRKDGLTAFVDLAGLGPGRYNLPVRVDSVQSAGVSRVEPSIVMIRIR